MVDIKGLFKNILVVIAVVLASIPLWNNSPSNAGAAIASSFKDMQVLLTFEGFDTLQNISDDDYEQLDAKTITLKNATKDVKEYNLVYVYSKNSTVDYKNIKIALDYQVFDLSDMKYTEDENYYYFILDSDKLDAYSSMNIDARIWTTQVEGSLTSTFIIM